MTEQTAPTPSTEIDHARHAAIQSGEYEFTFGGGFAAGWDAARTTPTKETP